jgi:diadenylate cyclase
MPWLTRLRRFLAGLLGPDERPDRAAAVHALDEIATAVVAMASEHHGAIIVIEQSTGLDDVVENGVRMNALVSAVLIEDIFCPNGPLHDKAVIIRGDRIAAASCPLPTTNESGSSGLGMRHRAGVGISERSDAIAVVVSEEKGTVSIGYNGHLFQLDDPSAVRFALYQLAERDGNPDLIPALQVV